LEKPGHSITEKTALLRVLQIVFYGRIPLVNIIILPQYLNYLENILS
jgi:hypothetical protein